MRYGLLNDIRVLDKTKLPLMVQRYVSLGYSKSQANTPPTYKPPHLIAQPISNALIRELKPNQKRLILCPGAEFGPAKQWSTDSYAQVANSMLAQNWQVVVMGSEADQQTGQHISSLIKPSFSDDYHDLTGKTTLEEAIDHLATADYVISNDSGLMHLAAALDRPLIALYGATSPNFTPPLSPQSHIVQKKVECGPCFQRTCPEKHHQCMTLITSTEVTQLLSQPAN
jgi:heptosyltransferase-2